MGLIAFLFFLVATLYSLVGFGGGSSYIALLVLFAEPFEKIPALALICNLIVVSGGWFFFNRFGHFKFKAALPYVVTSVPFAFLGGVIHIKRETFILVLGLSLLFAGLRLFFVKSNELSQVELKVDKRLISYIIGAGLGLLSGIVGIGGGIFLAPLLLSFRLARPKEVAAICSFFIFINSVSGLSGHLFKARETLELSSYLPLFLAVFIGGQLGSRFTNSQKMPEVAVKKLTAVLITFVAIRLLVTL